MKSMLPLRLLSALAITGITALTSQAQWSADANGVYIQSGKVGVGTTTPDKTLDVVGDLGITGSLFINGSKILTTVGSVEGGADYNVLLGQNAGANSTEGGGYSVMIGYSAGGATTTGHSNTFLGFAAGSWNTTSNQNTYIGRGAGEQATGSSNSFLGYFSGRKATGHRNTILGSAAGLATGFTSSDNVMIGEASGKSLTTGGNNMFVGSKSGQATTTGTNNMFLGRYAGYSNVSGGYNAYVGSNAGFKGTGHNNSMIGAYAGHENIGHNNTFLGYKAGHDNVNGSGNVFLGFQVGYSEAGSNKLYIDNSNTDAPLIYGEFDTNKVKINGDLEVTGAFTPGTFDLSDALSIGGAKVLRHHWGGDVEGYGTIMVGNTNNTTNTGAANILIGVNTGQLNTTGPSNTAVGYLAMNKNTTGKEGVFIGREAGKHSTGDKNVAVGAYSLLGATDFSGDFNTAVGNSTGLAMKAGSGNTLVGDSAGRTLVDGSYNMYLGRNTGFNNAHGSNNTYLGANAGQDSLGSNNVFIGFQAGFSEAGNNKLYIDNSNTEDPLIYGEFDNNKLKVNGELAVTGDASAPTLDLTQALKLGGVEALRTSNAGLGGTDNIAVGKAGNASMTGGSNMMMGKTAGMSITSGNNNTLIGINTGRNINTGSYNFAMGLNSLFSSTTASNNVAIGSSSLYNILAAQGNIAFGQNAGKDMITGNNNVLIGREVAQKKTAGNKNVMIGYRAGYNAGTSEGSVFIGDQAGANESNSNRLYIANSDTAAPLIYGEFDNKKVKVNGDQEVLGKLSAKEIKVTISGEWPDFVFADDYELPSLESVEDHIKEKRHLPGFPSAKEVKRDGLNVNEVVTAQTQKIEELTLHLIEMHKEMKALKAELAEIKGNN